MHNSVCCWRYTASICHRSRDQECEMFSCKRKHSNFSCFLGFSVALVREVFFSFIFSIGNLQIILSWKPNQPTLGSISKLPTLILKQKEYVWTGRKDSVFKLFRNWINYNPRKHCKCCNQIRNCSTKCNYSLIIIVTRATGRWGFFQGWS